MRLPIISVASLVVLGFARVSSADRYVLTDVGIPLGYEQSEAYGINNSGQIAVTAAVGATRQGAFLYENGTYQNLGTIGGDSSTAVAINTSGQVTGQSWIAGNTATHAYVFSNGVMRDLGTLGGGSYGTGINAAGQVVGVSDIGIDSVYHGFLWSNGRMSDLGGIDGKDSVATGINSAGQVVGSSTAPSAAGVFYPVLFGATITRLDIGPGGATAINDAGEVVASLNSRAAVYTQGAAGSATNLGTLGGSWSYASDINETGQIVGTAQTKSGDAHAFIYANGTMLDLNALLPAGSGWTLQDAHGINDQGDIVGYGINPAGQTDAFLLSPITAPEPSMSLATLMFLGVTCVYRRRSGVAAE